MDAANDNSLPDRRLELKHSHPCLIPRANDQGGAIAEKMHSVVSARHAAIECS